MNETASTEPRRRLDRGHIYWYLSFDSIQGHRKVKGAWRVLSARENGDAIDREHWEQGNYYTDPEEAKEEADRLNEEEREKESREDRPLPRKVESEKDVEKYLVNRCVALGWIPLKYSSGITTGYPDRCILLPGGLTAWVEVKTTGEKPKRLQQIRIRQLQELGYFVRVVDTRKCVDVLIEILKLKLNPDGVPTA